MSTCDGAYREDVLERHRQRRIRGLERALKDVYIWAHTSGRLSELDEIMSRTDVPIPQEIVARDRMSQVWEEGFKRHPSRAIPQDIPRPSTELTRMLHYSALMPNASTVSSEMARDWLWKIARSASNLLPEGTDVLALALEEYSRAAQKHPGMTLECEGHTDSTRLFALVEEIGEVAACLTYDNDAETGHGSDLESEVIQVIALALAWATRYLEDGK